MSNSTAIATLLDICQSQNLHPSETQSWVRKQVRENNAWKGLNPTLIVLATQRQMNEEGIKL